MTSKYGEINFSALVYQYGRTFVFDYRAHVFLQSQSLFKVSKESDCERHFIVVLAVWARYQGLETIFYNI